MRFNDLQDVKLANWKAGQHWFDEDTISFFKCKFETGLIDGRYFITSEKSPNNPRRWTIREVDVQGHIHNVGAFQQYKSLRGARAGLTLHKEGLK